MATQKARDLRQESDDQLVLTLQETQTKLFRLRVQSETEKLQAPSEILKAKKTIARIKTIMRLRELGKETVATH